MPTAQMTAVHVLIEQPRSDAPFKVWNETNFRIVFLKKRRLALPDLYAEPLTKFGADAVDRWFSEQEIIEMVEFTKQLAV